MKASSKNVKTAPPAPRVMLLDLPAFVDYVSPCYNKGSKSADFGHSVNLLTSARLLITVTRHRVECNENYLLRNCIL